MTGSSAGPHRRGSSDPPGEGVVHPPGPLTPSTAAPAWTAFILSILGALVAAYLTYEHFTDSTTLACSDNGAVNCLKVTTSQWSVVGGVPVAMAGLGFFLAMTLLCAPFWFTRGLSTVRVISVAVGTVMVLWLIYVEVFKVEAICLWCTGVHLIMVLLLGAVLWWRAAERSGQRSDPDGLFPMSGKNSPQLS